MWKKLEYIVKNKHRNGGRKLLDERAARRLVRQTRVDRKQPLSDVTRKFNENNNAKTTWRNLKRYGCRGCVCKK